MRCNGSSCDRTKATVSLVFATHEYKLNFSVALTVAITRLFTDSRERGINHSGRLSVLVTKVMDHFPVEWFIEPFTRLKKLRKSGVRVAQK